MAPLTGALNSSITLPPNGFTYTGYVFNGWNTSSSGSGSSYAGGGVYVLSASVTLFAQWLTYAPVLSFDGNYSGTIVGTEYFADGRPPSAGTASITFTVLNDSIANVVDWGRGQGAGSIDVLGGAIFDTVVPAAAGIYGGNCHYSGTFVADSSTVTVSGTVSCSVTDGGTIGGTWNATL